MYRICGQLTLRPPHHNSNQVPMPHLVCGAAGVPVKFASKEPQDPRRTLAVCRPTSALTEQTSTLTEQTSTLTEQTSSLSETRPPPSQRPDLHPSHRPGLHPSGRVERHLLQSKPPSVTDTSPLIVGTGGTRAGRKSRSRGRRRRRMSAALLGPDPSPRRWMGLTSSREPPLSRLENRPKRHRVSPGTRPNPHPGIALVHYHETHPDSLAQPDTISSVAPRPASAAPAGRGPSVGPTPALGLITRETGCLIVGLEKGHRALSAIRAQPSSTRVAESHANAPA
ncbi:unnamed protein product [Gadus morhua 'NCC']